MTLVSCDAFTVTRHMKLQREAPKIYVFPTVAMTTDSLPETPITRAGATVITSRLFILKIDNVCVCFNPLVMTGELIKIQIEFYALV